MIKAVLDANVFISGILNQNGAPATVIKAWQDQRFHLVTSLAILAEIRRVLRYPKIARRHRWTEAEAEQFIGRIARSAIVTSWKIMVSIVKADPSDDHYLAAAIEGEADCIVTGDSHLLDLAVYKGIEILSPRQFVDLLP